MRRGPKPAKSKEAKPPVARKSSKNGAARVSDLEKRLGEALEQQAATAEILRVISTSPTDLQPVFETIAESVVRLCGAEVSGVLRFDGSLVYLAAYRNFSPAVRAIVPQDYPMAATRRRMSGRAILDRAVVHVPDVLRDPDYPQEVARSTGWRSFLSVPMLREAQAIGAVTVVRTRPGPFSDRQIELLKTFADQAVIAIENVRLFTELQASNRELTTALDTQTATSDILRVISRTQTDVQPVFDAIVASAVRLLEADSGLLTRIAGDQIEIAALTSTDPAGDAILRAAYPLSRHSDRVHARVIRDRAPLNVADSQTDPRLPDVQHATARARGYRSQVVVPLLRHDEAVGAIAVTRREPGSFTEDKIALLKTFADQAVIAIENVRLFNETKEALERQTATSEILRVIASSPTNLQPVMDVVAENAARVCGATDALVYRLEDGELRLVASYGDIPAVRSWQRLDRGQVSSRAVIDREPVHVHDIEVAAAEFPISAKLALPRGTRTCLATPLLREGVPIGVIAIRRLEVRPFSDGQIELLKTFADQAVIAIENVRLFKELQQKNEALTVAHAQVTESLEQQTATSDILRAIASSPTDVQPVFDTVAESAASLCKASDTSIFRLDGDRLRRVAHRGSIPAGVIGEFTVPLVRGSFAGRCVLDGRIVHIADGQTEVTEFPEGSEFARRLGFRAILLVPLVREGVAIGVITLRRTEPRLFTDRQVALLQTFADQAVIAIENVRLFTELQEKNHALTEALEQQTATSEILQTITHTPTDVQPVFDTIVKSAMRLCDAVQSNLQLFDGQVMHWGAQQGIGREAMDSIRRIYPMRPDQSQTASRAVLTRSVVHLPDVLDDPEYRQELALKGGWRSVLSVPMMRDGGPIGAITVARPKPGPFSETQLALLKTFADQAVIAIENVRLFKELEEKNRALTEAHTQVTEALEQQTATSEVLRAISGSLTDVQPVLDIIALNAARVCGARDGAVLLKDEADLCVASHHGPLGFAMHNRQTRIPIGRDWASGRSVLEKRAIQVEDLLAAGDEYPRGLEMARIDGHRTTLATPLLREGEPIGVLLVRRGEVRLFTPKQMALLETFAAQAVIAIENVRLFTELQASNRGLTTALDTQTATSDILRVISRSRTDVQPVFDAIVTSAVRLLRAHSATLSRVDGEQIRLAAVTGIDRGSAAADALRAAFEYQSVHAEGGPHALAIRDRVPLNIADTCTDPRLHDTGHAYARARGVHGAVAVPLLRRDEAIGAITVARGEPGEFTDDEIALLQTFAEQAVIAIENARLLSELQARTQELSRSVNQLTALGEVGRAVSSTLDLETVLTTIVSRAVELSGLDGGVVFEYDAVAEEFEQRASIGQEALAEARRRARIRKGEGVVGRTAVTHEPVQVPDITREGAYEGRLRESLVESGVRALLAVPMLREGQLIGSLVVARNTPGAFLPETVDLLRTFATQSALAIQNARLFREIEDKSRQLEVASQHKSEFLANMSHELRTPLNAIIGFSEVLSERMFGELNEKQEEYSRDIHASGQHLLSLINDILDLSKIEAGRMELELTDFDLPMALDNALTLVRERAGRRSITLQTSVDERLGDIRADERKVRQVVLNLLSNAIKFTPEGGRIEVAAVPKDGSVEVSVSDTGVGIAPEDQEAVFEEFRQVGTAEKKVEGTGLGLTLCRKFVELHGGRIWVKSQVGVGSTFTFSFPLRNS